MFGIPGVPTPMLNRILGGVVDPPVMFALIAGLMLLSADICGICDIRGICGIIDGAAIDADICGIRGICGILGIMGSVVGVVVGGIMGGAGGIMGGAGGIIGAGGGRGCCRANGMRLPPSAVPAAPPPPGYCGKGRTGPVGWGSMD